MKYRESLNGVWDFYPDYDGGIRDIAELAYAKWQPITVPAAWENQFVGTKKGFAKKQERLVRAQINGGAWHDLDLDPYCDGKAHWLAIPIYAGSLRLGDNEVYIASTSANYGIDDAQSFDVFGSAVQDGTRSFFSQDAIVWHSLPDREWNIRLQTGQSEADAEGDATFTTLRFDDGNTDFHMSVGLNVSNGTPIYLKKIITIESERQLKDARIIVHARVGSQLSVPFDDYEDTRKYDGVGWYRRVFFMPVVESDELVWLQFGAADYLAEVWVNGVFAGSHEGGYTPFRFDLSELGIVNKENAPIEVIVRVTDQSDPRVSNGAGRFPIKETLAGFMQDSVGLNYGGLWHHVELEVTSSIYIEDIFIEPDVDGNRIIANLSLCNKSGKPATVHLTADIFGGESISITNSASDAISIAPGERLQRRLEVGLDHPRLWSIDDPYLYTADFGLVNEGRVMAEFRRPFGMRKIEAKGSKILFNDAPIQLTGMLHWGMYLDTLAVRPSLEQVRKEIRDLKNAGFNAVKFTLFDPPSYVLDEYDRMGMYAYIEYPIWNPTETPAFYERARKQIREMLIKDRNHPSVILSDFNCEMHFFTAEMDELMRELVDAGKELAPNRLYLDNSSNGITRYGDFYAVHPYHPLDGFREAIGRDVKRREEQADKPLVLGEYADTDTIRDSTAVRAANGGELPWWWSFFRVADPEIILHRQGYTEAQIATFKRTSRLNALMAKKHYMEGSKFHDRVAAMFITHLNDIPVTQPGIYDDNFELKFDPLELRKFASESVLLLERETQNYWCGKEVKVRPYLSHYGNKPISAGIVTWALMQDGFALLTGRAEHSGGITNGGLTPLGEIIFKMPDLPKPSKLGLVVRFVGECVVNGEAVDMTNDWSLWAYPKRHLAKEEAGGGSLAYVDAEGVYGIETNYPWASAWTGGSNPHLLVTTVWNENVARYVNDGGSLLYVGSDFGIYPIKSGGFNMHAYAVMPAEHSALGDFPHEGFSDQQFLEMSTQRYMDTKIPSWEADEHSVFADQPIIARIDLRSYAAGAYIAEKPFGEGRILQTTLRMGSSPVAGRYLLDQLIRYLMLK